MRAVLVEQYGGPQMLKPVELAEPEPGPGQVAIDVAYAGINYADVLARRDGYQVAALPFVPGLEVSGTVRALGPGAAGFAVGQRAAVRIRPGIRRRRVHRGAARGDRRTRHRRDPRPGRRRHSAGEPEPAGPLRPSGLLRQRQ